MKNAPAKGDYVHIDFDPQAGHEQAGHRFGLVLSPADFNRITGFARFAPITTRVKGYPFEVRIPPGERCKGAVLIDRTKSLDWKARNLVVKGKSRRAAAAGFAKPKNATAFDRGAAITITRWTTR